MIHLEPPLLPLITLVILVLLAGVSLDRIIWGVTSQAAVSRAGIWGVVLIVCLIGIFNTLFLMRELVKMTASP